MSRYISFKSLILAVCLIAVLGYIYNNRTALHATGNTVGDRELPIYCVDTTEPKIALSFDAAWGNEDTQTLIDILDKYDIHATFFVVGDWVDKYPESVKALHDAGHEVMSHSTHHDHYNSLTSSQIVADIQESCDKIEAVTGCSPTLIRCPYGEYDDHVISAVRSLGMEPIQWDVEQPEMT